RRFVEDFKKMLKKRPPAARPLRGSVATGTLFFPVLKDCIEQFNAQCGTELKPVGVINDYFGDEATVAGLLSGRDFLKARADYQGDFLVLPPECVTGERERFLDDMTLPQLSAELGLTIHK